MVNSKKTLQMMSPAGSTSCLARSTCTSWAWMGSRTTSGVRLWYTWVVPSVRIPRVRRVYILTRTTGASPFVQSFRDSVLMVYYAHCSHVVDVDCHYVESADFLMSRSLKATMWLDAVLPFSHKYSPSSLRTYMVASRLPLWYHQLTSHLSVS